MQLSSTYTKSKKEERDKIKQKQKTEYEEEEKGRLKRICHQQFIVRNSKKMTRLYETRRQDYSILCDDERPN